MKIKGEKKTCYGGERSDFVFKKPGVPTTAMKKKKKKIIYIHTCNLKL